jgi:hypothetical protein
MRLLLGCSRAAVAALQLQPPIALYWPVQALSRNCGTRTPTQCSLYLTARSSSSTVTSAPTSIVLYASELAACIGKNRYQDVTNAQVKVWQRVDLASLHEALSRNSIAVQQPVELDLEAAAHSTPDKLDAAVQDVLLQALIPADDALLEKAKAVSTVAELAQLSTPAVPVDAAVHAKIQAAAADAVAAQRSGAPAAVVDQLVFVALQVSKFITLK